MKIILDTNAYCFCDLGNEQALEMLEQADSLFLPIIVYGELYFGFKNGKRFQFNIKRLEQFIDEFNVTVIEINKEIAQKFGDIFTILKKKGHPIPTNDIWISACCMAVGGHLLTADRHFTHVDQIQIQLIENEQVF